MCINLFDKFFREIIFGFLRLCQLIGCSYWLLIDCCVLWQTLFLAVSGKHFFDFILERSGWVKIDLITRYTKLVLPRLIDCIQMLIKDLFPLVLVEIVICVWSERTCNHATCRNIVYLFVILTLCRLLWLRRWISTAEPFYTETATVCHLVIFLRNLTNHSQIYIHRSHLLIHTAAGTMHRAKPKLSCWNVRRFAIRLNPW